MLSILFLLFIELTWATLQGAFLAFLAVVFALWLWKSGLPQSLFTTTNSLLEKRTAERDDALKDVGKLKVEIEELDETIKMLRREVNQRYEIHHEDQTTIKALKEEIWKLQR